MGNGCSSMECARRSRSYFAPLAATSAAVPVTDTVAPPPQPLVSEDALARSYRAVSVAERKGSFSGHFEPLEETGWIHFYANDLKLFSPPYLHRGTRPTITSAPERVVYGTIFNVGISDAQSVGRCA